MKRSVLLFLLSLITVLFAGCAEENPSFFDVRWMRTTGNDAEFIRFSGNGEFHYYCACGNPVNDSDLCNGFSYNAETKTITLDYSEKTDETITEIVVQKSTDNELILNFSGDIRTFSKGEAPSQTGKLIYNGTKYFLVDYPSDIFRYELTFKDETKENKIYPINYDRWDLVHYNGRLFVSELTVEEVSIYYDNYKNYDWKVRVRRASSDQQYELPLSLDESELQILHNMQQMAHEDKIFSDQVDTFATLMKLSKDGFICGEIELVWYNENWYWRSGVIDEGTQGSPEYIYKLPSTLTEKIALPSG